MAIKTEKIAGIDYSYDDEKVTPEDLVKVRNLATEAMKTAATQTKSQLHTDIEKAQQEAQAAQAERDNLAQKKNESDAKVAALEQEKKDLAEKLNAYEVQKKTEGLDKKTSEAIEASTREMNAKLAALEDAFTETKIENENLKKAFDQQKLETLKQTVIAQAQGKIFPELIQGNTEAEIMASAENAKSRYSEMEATIRSNLKIAPEVKVPGGEEPPAPVVIERLDISKLRNGFDYQQRKQSELSKVYEAERAKLKQN
jgi:chromosome segregation ATPase